MKNFKLLWGEAYTTDNSYAPCIYCNKRTRNRFDNRPERFCGKPLCKQVRTLQSLWFHTNQRMNDLIEKLKTFDREE